MINCDKSKNMSQINYTYNRSYIKKSFQNNLPYSKDDLTLHCGIHQKQLNLFFWDEYNLESTRSSKSLVLILSPIKLNLNIYHFILT